MNKVFEDGMKNITLLMKMVMSVLMYRKIYKYTIVANIQFFNRREGLFYPGENRYCWGETRDVEISVYSFNKISESTFYKLSRRYAGMLLPGNEKEITEKFISEFPEFFTMNIEEKIEKIRRDVYL